MLPNRVRVRPRPPSAWCAGRGPRQRYRALCPAPSSVQLHTVRAPGAGNDQSAVVGATIECELASLEKTRRSLDNKNQPPSPFHALIVTGTVMLNLFHSIYRVRPMEGARSPRSIAGTRNSAQDSSKKPEPGFVSEPSMFQPAKAANPLLTGAAARYSFGAA